MNEIIDKVLSDLYIERTSRFNPDLYLLERFSLDKPNSKAVIEQLKFEKLVDFSNHGSIQISEHGIIVQTQFQGWLGYLDHLQEVKRKEEERLAKEDEKLDLDITLAKWQKKVFWPLFFIALIGGIPQLIEWIELLIVFMQK